jgi:RimJ/RimL family protein N-acetyltransferase
MEQKVALQKILLRKWQKGDEDAIVKHANNKEIAKFLKDSFPTPYTHFDAYRWIKFANHQSSGNHMAIVVEDEVVGCIGLEVQEDVYRKSAELGYWLSEDFWNRGIMTHVVKNMIEMAFANLPIVRLYAYVFEGNTASMRVLEKAGFELECIQKKAVYKDQKLLDQYVYAIVRM